MVSYEDLYQDFGSFSFRFLLFGVSPEQAIVTFYIRCVLKMYSVQFGLGCCFW